MTIEPNPIRVKPLLPTSNGAEPVSYMLELIKQGYDRFYVLVPVKFHFECRQSRFLLARRLRDSEHVGAQETDTSIHNAHAPSYLQPHGIWSERKFNAFGDARFKIFTVLVVHGTKALMEFGNIFIVVVAL